MSAPIRAFCLIQVCNGEGWLLRIDPLRLDDLQPCSTSCTTPAFSKVLHAARQDLRSFLHDYRGLPMPVFDTQPAAALGHGDQIGYASLVRAAAEH